MRSTNVLQLILFVLMFSSIPAQSQTGTGSIDGVIVDAFGLPVADGIVMLRSRYRDEVSAIIHQSTVTGIDGSFSFAGVPNGPYAIEASAIAGKLSQKQIEVGDGEVLTINLKIVTEPCSENGDKVSKLSISDDDKASIVGSLIDTTFTLFKSRPKKYRPSVMMLIPANVERSWLSAEHLKKVEILDRDAIQKVTERNGGQEYFRISEMTQRGQCVAVTIFNMHSLKGSFDDANMAGGGSVYEFRKVGEKWQATFFSGWIS